MEEDAELVELETAPEAGVRGITVARDRGGLYVAEAPKSLRVHQGDRLLSARFYFEGAPPEEVGRVLEGAKSCKVSFRLRRRRDPPPRDPPGASQGYRGKVARLHIPIPTPSKKPPPAPVSATPLPGSVALEFALPKPGKNRGKSGTPAAVATATEPRRPLAAPARLTVKEAAAAAGKTPPAMEEPPAKTEIPGGAAAEAPAGTGRRIPAVEVAPPKIGRGLSLAPQPEEAPAFRLPQVEVVVPALPEPGATLGRPQKKPESPVPKAKLPAFGEEEEEEDEERGRRRGFAGLRLPSIAVAAPSAAVELLPELGVTQTVSPSPPTPVRPAVPAIDIAVPRLDVDLALPAAPKEEEEEEDDDEDGAGIPEAATRFAKGLRKLSLELEPPPGVEMAPPAQLKSKPAPAKSALPRLGSALAKLRMGKEGEQRRPRSPGRPPAPAVGSPAVALDLALGRGGAAGVKLKVPKLSLVAPFGIKDGDAGGGGKDGPRDASPAAKLPWLGIGGPVVVGGGSGGVSVEAGSPGTPRLRVPRVGIALAAAGNRRAPSLPKLPAEPEPGKGAKLPKFGGSSPDIRTGGGGDGSPETVRRGGSAESLSAGPAGRKKPESPGAVRSKLKTQKVTTGDGGGQPSTPRFTVPAVGFTAPVTQPDDSRCRKTPKGAGGLASKVPALELAPPGMEEATRKETATPGRRSRVKLPKFGPGFGGSRGEGEGRMRMEGVKKAVLVLVKPKEKGGDNRVVEPHPHLNGEAEGKARRRRWVPRVGFSPGGSPPEPPKTQPKGGRMQFPDVELCPGNPQLNQRPATEMAPRFNLGGFGGEGAPKFQLPKLELSPQPCGEQ